MRNKLVAEVKSKQSIENVYSIFPTLHPILFENLLFRIEIDKLGFQKIILVEGIRTKLYNPEGIRVDNTLLFCDYFIFCAQQKAPLNRGTENEAHLKERRQRCYAVKLCPHFGGAHTSAKSTSEVCMLNCVFRVRNSYTTFEKRTD